MLQLRIGFPGGRYFAASAEDPRQPEWPPHPSRAFSALVAAAYAGGRQPSSTERQLLERLEAAPAPALDTPDADLRPAPDAFVPVNDEKTRLNEGKGKVNSGGVTLPLRQARQFPAAFFLNEPEVSFLWPLEVSPEELQTLDGLAARVTHVGTSHSLVTASFSLVGDVPVRWAQQAGGAHFLRVPCNGRLEELDRLVNHGHGTLRRPAPLCEAMLPYGQVGAASDDPLPALHDWVVLRLDDASWGADTAHSLGRSLRRAVLSIMADQAPASVHGHDQDCEHVAWIALPDVGHRFASGKVRGLGIGLPWSMSQQERALTLAALSRLNHLKLPDGQVATVSPSHEGPQTPLVLRSRTWTASSQWWSTVTPIVLDRPPKRATAERVAAAVAQSLQRAGHPCPLEVLVLGSSDFAGAPSAMQVPATVPRVHARVRFERAICGPVLAGRWRNFGIGVLRPTPVEAMP